MRMLRGAATMFGIPWGSVQLVVGIQIEPWQAPSPVDSAGQTLLIGDALARVRTALVCSTVHMLCKIHPAPVSSCCCSCVHLVRLLASALPLP